MLTKKPKKRRLARFLMVVSFLLLMAGTLVFYYFNANGINNYIDTPSFKNALNLFEQEKKNKVLSDNAIGDVTETISIAVVDNELDLRIDQIKNNIENIQNIVTNLETVISLHKNKLDNLDVKVSKNEKDSNQMHQSNQRSQRVIDDLEKITVKVQKQIARLQQRVTLLTEQQQKKQIKPGFLLLSVDIWDQQPQARIAVGNNQDIITVGDVRLGWAVMSIDFYTQSMMLNKAGLVVTLYRQGTQFNQSGGV